MKRTYIRAAAWLALLAVFVVSAYTALMLWKLRPQQFILSAEPFALREDSKALSLARNAMRDAGYGTKDFVANSLSYDNTFPDFRRYNFSASPGMPTHPGFYVQLEQEGADVQVMIRRRK